jgi:hypothetical protein
MWRSERMRTIVARAKSVRWAVALLSEQQKATLTAWENRRPGSRSWRPIQTGYKGN